MKSLLLPAIVMLTILQGSAQSVAINTTGNVPHPTAILDLSANDKGILIPRMSTSEREAIVNPATGLMVYDTDARNFWFYAPGWQEIITNQDMGTAGGDLNGTYPSPNVAKLQGHPVSGFTPQDMQVLKWNASEYQWKGMNDSLSLPFVASAADPSPLFSITNTFNGFSTNNLAILGRRISGSGIEFNFPTAIWGDAYAGTGLLGTSHTHEGVYGKSEQNHGVYGTSNGGWTKAGLYGFGTGGAAGVRGETEDGSIGVHGKATGADASAGKFENTYPTNDYPAMIVMTNGFGNALEVSSTNNTSNSPAVTMTTHGNGKALEVTTTQTTSINPAVSISTSGIGKALEVNASNEDATEPAVEVNASGNGHGIAIAHNGGSNTNGLNALHEGSGTAIYGKSTSGPVAKFENTNSTNANSVLSLSTNSMGSSLSVNSAHTGATANVVDVTNNGVGTGLSVSSPIGNAASFTINNPTTNKTNVSMIQHGTGRGLYINMLNAATTLPALDIINQGTKGILTQVNANNAIAITGSTGATANNTIGVKGVTAPNATNGIGVLGQAGVNDPNGIGVKGIAGGDNDGGIGVLGETSVNTPLAIAVKGIGYTHNEDVGAITGINMVDGVGVFGEALGYDGIGIAGTVGNTGNHSVAAVFTNKYTENNRSVVEIISNGKGNGLLIDHNSLTSTSPIFRIMNSGTGQFMRFETGLGEIMTTLSKQGDFVTKGTIKVKNDKGIVRSSTDAQQRIEHMTVDIPEFTYGACCPEFVSVGHVEVVFDTPFSDPPIVLKGNIVSGYVGDLRLQVEDVTESGFTIAVQNLSTIDWSIGPNTEIKFVAIGNE